MRPDEIVSYNRAAWDRLAEQGNRWTVPVTTQEVAAARRGEPRLVLTATLPLPAAWLPPLDGCRVLCLACGGGQQGPLLAAAGARVTVLDNAPAQLARDAEVAAREGLQLDLVTGDMADLSRFPDAAFDLVFHPVSNCFAPDVHPVWRGTRRVLRDGGLLLAGHMNPVFYVFDPDAAQAGRLDARYTLPYADAHALPPDRLARQMAAGEPLEFGHTLEDLIGGQLAAGFVVTGFYEDRFPPGDGEAVSRLMPTMFATRAVAAGSEYA